MLLLTNQLLYYFVVEILKVEVKDVKTKLVSSEFYREKAKLQVK